MKAQAKNIIKAQERRVNVILALGFILIVCLSSLAFRPIKYTEVPEVKEVQEVQEKPVIITLNLPCNNIEER